MILETTSTPPLNFSFPFSRLIATLIINGFELTFAYLTHIPSKISVCYDYFFVDACECTGFGWGRVKVLHSSLHSAVVSICNQNSADNTGLFLLLLSSAHAESRSFLFLS